MLLIVRTIGETDRVEASCFVASSGYSGINQEVGNHEFFRMPRTVIAHINTADGVAPLSALRHPCAARYQEARPVWFQSFKYSGAGVGLW